MADTCKWMADNEICCNDKCPMCADFCPVTYEPGVCRYEDRDGAEGGGEDGLLHKSGGGD